MFFFDRSRVELPKWYQSDAVIDAMTPILHFLSLDAEERLQTRLPELFQNQGLGEEELLDALRIANKSRCAFCECESSNLQLYRFRPTGNVVPAKTREDREHYIWLAWSWENLLPICESCIPEDGAQVFPIRTGTRIRPADIACQALFELVKSDVASEIPQFLYSRDSPGVLNLTRRFLDTTTSGILDPAQTLWPSYDTEKPLFFEPGKVDRPAQSFDVKLDGTLVPKPTSTGAPLLKKGRAAATIEYFNLNDPKKISDRKAVFQQRLDKLREYAHGVHEGRPNELFEFDEIEFASAWYLLLRRLGLMWCSREGVARRLQPKDIKRTYERLLAKGSVEILDESIAKIRRLDELGMFDIPAGEPEETAAQDVPDFRKRPQSEIQKVVIQNFKALEFIEMELFSSSASDSAKRKFPDGTSANRASLLLLGENATGKSSILEAIAIATLSANALQQLELDYRKWVLRPEYMGTVPGLGDGPKADPRETRICVTLADGTVFETRFDQKREPERRVQRNGENWQSIEDIQSPLVFAYGAHRLFGDKTRSTGAAANVRTLFENGALLTDPEDWLISLHERNPDELNAVVAVLRDIISIDGQFSHISVDQDPLNTSKQHCQIHLKKTHARVSEQDTSSGNYEVVMPLSAVSSGYRTVIALVCDIISGLAQATKAEKITEDLLQTPCTVLVDEIEAHLHPRWKLLVITGLRRTLPNATFFITSHDPLCIRGMLSGEIFVMNRRARTDAGAKTDLLEVVEQQKSDLDTGLFTVQQLLTSDLFSLLTTDEQTTDIKLAEHADFLGENSKLERWMGEQISDALPVGDTEVVQLIQDAVRDYLRDRTADAGNTKRREARKKATNRIKDALKKSYY